MVASRFSVAGVLWRISLLLSTSRDQQLFDCPGGVGDSCLQWEPLGVVELNQCRGRNQQGDERLEAPPGRRVRGEAVLAQRGPHFGDAACGAAAAYITADRGQM